MSSPPRCGGEEGAPREAWGGEVVILTVRPRRHTVRTMTLRAMVLLMVIAGAAAMAAAGQLLFLNNVA